MEDELEMGVRMGSKCSLIRAKGISAWIRDEPGTGNFVRSRLSGRRGVPLCHLQTDCDWLNI
jgi:hypothetical protein